MFLIFSSRMRELPSKMFKCPGSDILMTRPSWLQASLLLCKSVAEEAAEAAIFLEVE